MTKIAEKALSLKSRDIYAVYIGYGVIRDYQHKHSSLPMYDLI